MEKWMMTIETNCLDPAQEKKFNEWYDGVHLADVLSIPGVVSATRYENPGPAEGQGKFLALYEIEADDALQVMADLSAGMARWTEQGRLFPALTIVGGGLYRQITPPVTGK
jgi:hypothetical protein